MKKICVFCSSSDMVENSFKEEAKKLAQLFLTENYTLIYGGAKVGMMGVLAKSMTGQNGYVIGVMPQLIHSHNLAESSVDELIITEDMKSRKATMAQLSDAFIALPGGFGTLEELIEVITLKQLGCHSKPVIIINTNGFYDKLNELFEMFYSTKFAKCEYRNLYFFVNSAQEAVAYLRGYKPEDHVSKWGNTGAEN